MDASIHSRNPSIAQLRRRGDLIAAKAVGCLILLCMSLSVAPSAAADPVRNVLVIYSDNRLLPANLEVDAALREALVGPTKSGVELYTEFLDRSRFAGAEYEATTSTYLAEKYAKCVAGGGRSGRRVCVALPDGSSSRAVSERSHCLRRPVAGRNRGAGAAAERRHRRAGGVRLRGHHRPGVAVSPQRHATNPDHGCQSIRPARRGRAGRHRAAPQWTR